MVDDNRQFDPNSDAEFDQELRQSLAPRSAPPNFVARVLQQIPSDSQPIENLTVPHSSLVLAGVGEDKSPSMSSRRARIFSFSAPVRLAAVASVLIVILAGSFAWHQHQRRIAGEHARQQVMMALQITQSTLQQVADNVSSIQNRKDIQP